MNVWLTADLHLGHQNMTAEGKTPFHNRRPFETVAEMDRTLIANWNLAVAKDDWVYVVGDFTLGNLKAATGYFARLNGRIAVIPGSHDEAWTEKWIKGKLANFEIPTSKSGHPVQLLPALVTIKLPGIKMYEAELAAKEKVPTQTLTMCHYQMASWPLSHYGTLSVFGHHHGRRKGIGKSMDVGVDTNQFYPYPLAAVVKELSKIKAVAKY